VDTDDLLVDVSSFPADCRVDFGPFPPPQGKPVRGELEGSILQFRCGDVTASHFTGRYGSPLRAAASYYLHNEFSAGERLVTPWAAPPGWNYQSLVASRSRVACGEYDMLGDPFQVCQAVAQYGEYISVFRTTLSRYGDSMTFTDLESILIAIDSRMAQRLDIAAE
jgi:hypothetical protein